MEVLANWDQPRRDPCGVGSSYYPPLRFPGLAGFADGAVAANGIVGGVSTSFGGSSSRSAPVAPCEPAGASAANGIVGGVSATFGGSSSSSVSAVPCEPAGHSDCAKPPSHANAPRAGAASIAFSGYGADARAPLANGDHMGYRNGDAPSSAQPHDVSSTSVRAGCGSSSFANGTLGSGDKAACNSFGGTSSEDRRGSTGASACEGGTTAFAGSRSTLNGNYISPSDTSFGSIGGSKTGSVIGSGADVSKQTMFSAGNTSRVQDTSGGGTTSGACYGFTNGSAETRVFDGAAASTSSARVRVPSPLQRPQSPPQRASDTGLAGVHSVLRTQDAKASDPTVEVRGDGNQPGPWRTWADVDFPSKVRAPLLSAGFPAPTVIQQHAWPILATGRDLIGVAKTGSGKTLAFLLPAFSRLVESRADMRGPPAILVMAPTRELACQIEQEAKGFGGTAGMRAACLYGGAPKGPQLAELRSRPQVLVATPGRLNDLLDPAPGLTLAVDVKSVKYLVLDEADRMLDMGFEPQIRKVISGLPQDRQTVMFTATWPPAVRRLASEFQKNPIEVRVGEVEQLLVNRDIEQRVVFCEHAFEKEERLAEILREFPGEQAIVFVNTKRMCEVVAMRVGSSITIHGDKDQRERDAALNAFKSGAKTVLVATDVAARGLDIKSVKLVVNFDPPHKDEDYVHRVGRTGRAGKKGTAIALLTNEDGTAARFIEELLKRDGLPVPEELSRRIASGEMRTGGGGGRRDPSREPRRGREPSRGRSFGGRGDDDFNFLPMDDDFGGRNTSTRALPTSSECPTW